LHDEYVPICFIVKPWDDPGLKISVPSREIEWAQGLGPRPHLKPTRTGATDSTINATPGTEKMRWVRNVWSTNHRGRCTASDEGENMIILGLILMLIGLVAKIPILWSVGILVAVVGVVLMLLGMAGREVRGRRHYY
jgi:hypothetical protein